MRLSAALLLAAISLAGLGQAHASSQSFHLKPRDYDNRDYYAVHLTERRSPEDVAKILGLEYEGHLGVMDDVHMFSARKRSEDIVARQIERFERRKRKREEIPQVEYDVFGSIGFTEKQRMKRLVKRAPPPLPKNRKGIFDSDDVKVDPELDARREQVMKALDIRDPIFKDQWHLVGFFP